MALAEDGGLYVGGTASADLAYGDSVFGSLQVAFTGGFRVGFAGTLNFLTFAQATLTRELNAATDNPLIFPESGDILSGGNFHGAPVAAAFDYAAIALTSLASISSPGLSSVSIFGSATLKGMVIASM